MSAPKWYWPRQLARAGAVSVYFAPTFFAVGIGFYPESPSAPAAVSFGVWPFMIGIGLRPAAKPYSKPDGIPSRDTTSTTSPALRPLSSGADIGVER